MRTQHPPSLIAFAPRLCFLNEDDRDESPGGRSHMRAG